jgi:transposase
MAARKWQVKLTEADRTYLLSVVRRGEAKARKVRRAHILLLSDEGQAEAAVAAALHASRGTVQRIRRRYCEAGVDAALEERPRPGGQPMLDTKGEATLVALACSDAPEGRVCWTMQLLADQLVALGVVEQISDETVRRLLKKTS